MTVAWPRAHVRRPEWKRQLARALRKRGIQWGANFGPGNKHEDRLSRHARKHLDGTFGAFRIVEDSHGQF